MLGAADTLLGDRRKSSQGWSQVLSKSRGQRNRLVDDVSWLAII